MLLKAWAFLALITTANAAVPPWPIERKHVTPYRVKQRRMVTLGGNRTVWSCNFDHKKWSTHSPDCFRAIYTENLADVRTKITPHAEIFAKGIKVKDIAACRTFACLRLLTEILTGKLKSSAKIPSDALSELDPFQINRIMVERAALVAKRGDIASLDAKTYYNFLEALKPETLARLGPIILKNIIKTSTSLVGKIPLEEVKETLLTGILSRPETCAILDGVQVGKILSSGKGKSLTAACMNKVRNLNAAAPTKLGNALDGFLSQTNKALHEDMIKLLDAKKVSLLASEVEAAQLPGAHFDFKHLKKESVDNANPSLKVALVVGKLNSLLASADIFDHASGTIITKFKGDYFEPVSKEDGVTALRNLSGDDLLAMSAKALQTLIEKFHIVCSSLPVRNYKEISFTGPNAYKCFQAASAKAQSAIAVTAQGLADNIFLEASQSKFDDWSLDKPLTGTKNDYGKHEILEHVASKRPNGAAIIANFGRDPSEDSACKGLGNVEELSTYKKLSEFLPRDCFNAVKDRTIEEGAKVHPRYRMLQPFSAIRKDEKLIKSLTIEQLRYLAEVPEFCRGADIKLFNDIPLTALPGLPPLCFAQMSFRGELALTTLQALDKDIYMSIPRDRITSNMINAMTGEQLATACTKVTDESQNNIGPLFTATVLSSLDKKVAFITVAQWRAVPVKSFAAINANLLSTIKPANMAEWTLQQVQEIEKAVLATLTSEQAAVIGTKASAEHSPIKYLASLTEIPEGVRAILEKNIPAGAPAAEESTDYTMWLIIAAVIVGVLIIGGAVYFFMSR